MEIRLVILFLSRKKYHAKQIFVLSSSMKLGPGRDWKPNPRGSLGGIRTVVLGVEGGEGHHYANLTAEEMGGQPQQGKPMPIR